MRLDAESMEEGNGKKKLCIVGLIRVLSHPPLFVFAAVTEFSFWHLNSPWAVLRQAVSWKQVIQARAN